MSLDQLLYFFQNQNQFIIYGAIVAAAYVENLFPPFPGDSVTLAGAVVAGAGNTSYIGVLVSAVSGGFAGAMTLYLVGKMKGRKYFSKSRFFGEADLVKVETLFKRFGGYLIIFSRFVIGVRSAVSLAAGLANMEPLRMGALTAISFVIWNWLLLAVVFYSKANWDTITNLGEKYNIAIFSILAAAAAALLIRWIWTRKQNRS